MPNYGMTSIKMQICKQWGILYFLLSLINIQINGLKNILELQKKILTEGWKGKVYFIWNITLCKKVL